MATFPKSFYRATAAGFPGFLLWAFTEAAQQALTPVACRRWAYACASAETAVREILAVQVATYDAIRNSMFLLLLIGVWLWRSVER